MWLFLQRLIFFTEIKRYKTSNYYEKVDKILFNFRIIGIDYKQH